MLKTILLLSSVLAASASPFLSPRTTPNVVETLYDGQCFYPKPDCKDFKLKNYLGRWYQLAASRQPFSGGCACTFAQYSLNDAGTVDVFNSCQVGDQPVEIRGTATPVDKAYGRDGAFKVEFPSAPPASDCPGPNYVVQDYEKDFAIVQGPNFSGVFILSREQNVPDAKIDELLKRAERLGADLSTVDKTNQTGCLFT